jgi:hypothetical protein
MGVQKIRLATVGIVAAFLTFTCDGTPLVVGRSGDHIYIATNSIDSDGNSRCKLHFGKNAVVMWATQASSMTLIWPDGSTKSVDSHDALNNLIRNANEPLDVLKEMLVQDTEKRIRGLLDSYKAKDPDRFAVARDLVSEYVIVGKEHNGFLGVRVFTLDIADPQAVTFEVHDITIKLHNGEVIDYSNRDINIIKAHGPKGVRAALYAQLQSHDKAAQSFGNKAFAPPYLVYDVTRAGGSYLSDPGPCRFQP